MLKCGFPGKGCMNLLREILLLLGMMSLITPCAEGEGKLEIGWNLEDMRLGKDKYISI